MAVQYSKIGDFAVLRWVRSVFEGLSKNTRVLWLFLGAIFLIASAVGLMINRNDARNRDARNAFYSAQKNLELALKDLAKKRFPAAPSSATDITLKAREEAAEIAAALEKLAFAKIDLQAELGPQLQQLQKVISEYGSSRSAFDATMLLADLHFDHGQVAGAIPLYEKASLKAPSAVDRVLALKGLSAAYESTGKFSDAISALERAVQAGDGFLRGELLLSMARCYELAGDATKARAKYDEILAQLPNSESSQQAELAKAKLAN